MKLKLVIHEETAELVVSAENQWEKDTLKSMERFPENAKTVFVSCEEGWGSVTKGSLRITFHHSNK